MSKIYHLLSSDIPHHNRTVLDFFRNELLPNLPEQTHVFYVVSKESLDFPELALSRFSHKKAIAKAAVAVAKAEPTAKFVLHGQYNIWLWLALFGGKLPACRVIWHVWGADLYEVSDDWRFKLFYPLRRFVQKKLPQIWATKGDLDYVWRNLRPQTKQDRLIYFPTKMATALAPRACESKGETLTLLLGNSGDRSNNHIQALTDIHCRFGQKVKIVIPMGYPTHNDSYIEQVEQHGKRLFLAENLQILRGKIDFADYQRILTACDLGYFDFERQQGIGTICLLIQLGVPFALNRQNPFAQDLRENGVPFLFTDGIEPESVSQTARALSQIDPNTIGFFPSQYRQTWLEALKSLG